MPYYRRIHDLREDHDMTQKEVADYLGMKQPQYQRYESGMRDIPTDILIALSKLYHASVDYMLELSDNPHADQYDCSESKK